MARKRAMAVFTGRRTGVHFPTASQQPLSQEPEDMDAVFDDAGTPDGRENKNNAKSASNGDKTVSKPDNKSKKKELRFSLENAMTTVVSRDDNDDGASLQRAAAQRLQRKFRNTSRGSLSPSELSRVSTAPPSVRRDVEQDEDVEQARHGRAELHEALSSANATTTPVAAEQEQDDFDVAPPDSPLREANDYHDDDNFLPPPPESPVHEDGDDDDQSPLPQRQSLEEVPTQVDHSPVDFPTQFDDDDNDMGDDDKEGTGFAMAESPIVAAAKTPASTESEEEQEQQAKERGIKKKKAANKKKKEKKSSKKRSAPQVDDDETSQDLESEKPAKKSRKTKAKQQQQPRQNIFSPKGIQSGPLQFRAIPVTDEKELHPEEGNLRRSKRTRVKPLAWWKGERAEYGPNSFPEEIAQQGLVDMSEVKCYLVAEPTPYKPRKQRAPVTRKDTTGSSTKKKGKSAALRHEEEADEEFDTSKLRKTRTFLESDTAYLWDDNWEQADDMNVVAFKDSQPVRKLPLSRRKKNESKETGSASQAFNVPRTSPLYPGYIMGSLNLPPTAIKDAESVGLCAQTFTVVGGQKKAVEVAYAHPDEDQGAFDPKTAQRFLLSPGDMFRIPPGNCYRMQNHSSTHEAYLTWTIIRPNELQDHDE